MSHIDHYDDVSTDVRLYFLIAKRQFSAPFVTQFSSSSPILASGGRRNEHQR